MDTKKKESKKWTGGMVWGRGGRRRDGGWGGDVRCEVRGVVDEEKIIAVL